MAVIRGESCFEKSAFEDTENPHPPTKTQLLVKEYLEISKRFLFSFEALVTAYFIHAKLSFDNLNYFKLYGNLKL